jgi:hypothetical protein
MPKKYTDILHNINKLFPLRECSVEEFYKILKPYQLWYYADSPLIWKYLYVGANPVIDFDNQIIHNAIWVFKNMSPHEIQRELSNQLPDDGAFLPKRGTTISLISTDWRIKTVSSIKFSDIASELSDPSPYDKLPFQLNDEVDVTPLPDDDFDAFRGRVTDVPSPSNPFFYVVEDQDGVPWDVEEQQMTKMSSKFADIASEMSVVSNPQMSKIVDVLYAIYCAEKVLPLFENRFPNDKRPRTAIEAAKKWLNEQTPEAAEEAATIGFEADIGGEDSYNDAASSAAWAALTASSEIQYSEAFADNAASYAMNAFEDMGQVLNIVELKKRAEQDAVKYFRPSITSSLKFSDIVTQIPEKPDNRIVDILYAIYCVEPLVDIYEKKFPNDKRIRNAINSTKMWVREQTVDAGRLAAHDANIANSVWLSLNNSVYGKIARAVALIAGSVFVAEAGDPNMQKITAPYVAVNYATSIAEELDIDIDLSTARKKAEMDAWMYSKHKITANNKEEVYPELELEGPQVISNLKFSDILSQPTHLDILKAGIMPFVVKIKKYLSQHTHETNYELAYNIRYHIRIPDNVTTVLSDDLIDYYIQHETEQAINVFSEDIRATYPWIKNIYVSGRSGGWLQFKVDMSLYNKGLYADDLWYELWDYPIDDFDDFVMQLSQDNGVSVEKILIELRNTVEQLYKDLDDIEDKVIQAKDDFIKTIQSNEFWEQFI